MVAEAQFTVECVKQVGALPVIRRFCDRLQLAGIVNELIPKATQAAAGHGEALVALMMNKLTAPAPLYRLEEWAQECGAETLLGIRPGLLTDDRVGRLLDSVAEHVEPLKAAVCVRAIEEFGLDIGRIHWDLTSLEFMGAYDSQHPMWPLITYGYDSRGSGEYKQVRVANLTLGDGAVGGLLHRTYPGNTGDVNTVADYLPLFCELRDRFGKCPRLIGDTKLVSQEQMIKLHEAGLEWLCPETHTPVLDRQYLELQPEGWTKLDYLSRRDRDRAPDQRPVYKAQEVAFEIVVPTGETLAPPKGSGGGRPRKVHRTYTFRRIFIHSTEVLAAQRSNRKRLREKLESKLIEQAEKFASVYWKRQTEEKARRAVERLLESSVGKLYRYTLTRSDNGWHLTWLCDPQAVEQLERLDGYYTLATNVAADRADTSALFQDYKEQSEAERRFADWKGPLRVRPLFLKSNKRIIGLVMVLSMALLVYSLIEREARLRLKDTDGKMQGLLPASRPVRATGRNVLERLNTLSVVGVLTDQGLRWHAPRPNPVQASLLEMFGVDLVEMLGRLPRTTHRESG